MTQVILKYEILVYFRSRQDPWRVKKIQKFINFCLKVG